jgi:hypothetical protein
MRLIREHSDLINFGIELDLGKPLFWKRFVAVRFGHYIIGIEWKGNQ